MIFKKNIQFFRIELTGQLLSIRIGRVKNIFRPIEIKKTCEGKLRRFNELNYKKLFQITLQIQSQYFYPTLLLILQQRLYH